MEARRGKRDNNDVIKKSKNLHSSELGSNNDVITSKVKESKVKESKVNNKDTKLAKAKDPTDQEY
jgi:hypothetical protein